MIRIDRTSGQRLVFKTTAEWEQYVESKPKREIRRSAAGVSLCARDKSTRQDTEQNFVRTPFILPEGHTRQHFVLIHPTRGRPEKFARILRMWHELASEHNRIQSLVSIDLGCSEDYMKVFALFAGRYDFRVFTHDNGKFVDATNRPVVMAGFGDIVIQIADDMEPPPNWDLEIQQRVKYDVAHPWILEVCDGNQRDYKGSTQTLPIMSAAYLRECGYIYWPEYSTVYADNDFTDRARELGVNIEAWDLVFQHKHYLYGRAEADDTYLRQNAPEAYDLGKRVYEKRKAARFGLPTKKTASKKCRSYQS